MSEERLYAERPEPSESVQAWLKEHIPHAILREEFYAVCEDGPEDVRAYANADREWWARYHHESVTWPVHQDPYGMRVRYYGGEWLSGRAGVDYRDGDAIVSCSYIGTMNAMVKRGAPESEMRSMAARIYAYEAHLAALRREMADDLRRAMEGA